MAINEKKGKGVNQLNRQHVALHLSTPSHPLHHLFSIYHLIVVLYRIRFCCCNSLHHVCMMYDLCVKPRLLQLLYLLLAATHNQIAPLGLQVGYNRGLLLYNISICHCMFFPLSCLCVLLTWLPSSFVPATGRRIRKANVNHRIHFVKDVDYTPMR